MEEVKSKIRQDFIDFFQSHRLHKYKTSEFHLDKTVEVNKNENYNKTETIWETYDFSFLGVYGQFNLYPSLDWEDERNGDSDLVAAYRFIKRNTDQSCSDFSKHPKRDYSQIEEEEDDLNYYKELTDSKEIYLSYRETVSIQSLLDLYQCGIYKLFQLYKYGTVKEDLEVHEQEFLKVNTQYQPDEVIDFVMPHEYEDSIRLLEILCVIFSDQDEEDQLSFLCYLTEGIIKYQYEAITHSTIECYLEIQCIKNPLCTFDDLSTGISNPKFERQLKLCYCKIMLCKNQSNATDQSIEENLKYFTSSFDDVIETKIDEFKTIKAIFHSLIHALNKCIEQDHANNLKIIIETLQKIIRKLVIVDCYNIFRQYIFRDRWSTQAKKRWDTCEDCYICIPLNHLLRKVCGLVIEFLKHLKLIGKNLPTDMHVATIFEENKSMLRCLVQAVKFIAEEENLFLSRETRYVNREEKKEKILHIYMHALEDYSSDTGFVNIIKEFCEMEDMTWENEEVILKSICDFASTRFDGKHLELVKAILDINMIKPKRDLLNEITHILWDLLKNRKKKKSQNNIKTHQNPIQNKLQLKFADLYWPYFQKRDIRDEEETKNILYRCICILRNAKKQEQLWDVNISIYTKAFNFDEQSFENKDQVTKKSNTEIMLIIMLLLLVAATRHHKSAKLKKYMSLKYEYKEAILYILWCSGDIHVNPGPPMKKSQLIHDSQRERAWIQNMSSILLKLYKGKPPSSKPNNLWTEKPEHWPTNKPFYDTKNHAHDEYGCLISDHELLKCLIQCFDCKKVYINDIYKKEIAAWTENKIHLLQKLHTFRTETEKINMVLQNFIIYKDTIELQEALDNIHVKLSFKVEESHIRNVPCKRNKNQTEIFADITRYLAAVVCKLIKGKDPESKCDGIWTSPPEQWPTNVPFFSPFNRGKCKNTCSDQLLLSTLLQHPKAVIPPKYKSLVESYQNVVNSTDKKEAKKHKEVLCRVKSIQTDVSVLDYALKYLYSDGFFTTEVFHHLHQWWSGQSVDNQTEITFANLYRISEDRPQIWIEVTRECMTLSVMQSTMDYKTKSEVCYNISFDDNLPTKLDFNSQHSSDVDQLCTDINLQGTSVKKNSQIPHEQTSSSNAASLNDSSHGKNTTQYPSSNTDHGTDSSTTNETLFTRNIKLLPAERNSLPLSKLEKSKENAPSIEVSSILKREETSSRDSDGTNQTTDVSGINPDHTDQCDNNHRVIVPETNESQVFNEKESRGKKRKLSNESNDNVMSKTLVTESDIKNDSVHKKTGEESVSDHQFYIDFLLDSCIEDISFQHDKSTSELSKNESSFTGSAKDEIMDTSFPVSTDYDEVSNGLELLLDDLINYESGKTSRLEKELILDSL